MEEKKENELANVIKDESYNYVDSEHLIDELDCRLRNSKLNSKRHHHHHCPQYQDESYNFDVNGSTSSRFLTSRETFERRGSLNLLSQEFESLDYDTCENQLFLEEQKKFGYKLIRNKDFNRWLVIFLIGVLTASTGSLIVICVDSLSGYKYYHLRKWFDYSKENGYLHLPYFFWLLFNAVPIFLGSCLVTFVAPVAAGSGIPMIKSYLNGVKIPKVVRVSTFFVKSISVICSVVGGLAVGKEGPMIHCGAVIAAGISQGKTSTFNKDFSILTQFREDREKRDFVSAGAAAGVAAAFGAPIGGVLFSLEEGASFWNQALTWRIFFCSMISTFTLNLILSGYNDHFGQLSFPGLINFGKFENINYDFIEMPIYIVMGMIGGLMGSTFNYINYKLTVFRCRHIYQKWRKVFEAVLVSMVTATIGFILILISHDCRENKDKEFAFPVQYNCPEGQYSVMAALWFNTPEASVRSLFHDDIDTWTALSLILFFVTYFFLAIWTYGLSVSSGLFIPTLLAGASWGRLVSVAAHYFFPDLNWCTPGKFALLGAAATLGGVVRMTISLTVILIEATGNMTLGLPLMITLMVAKWVGDLFTEGIYDIHLQISSVPFLAWDAPPMTNNVYAHNVMAKPVITFNSIEKVSRIVQVLTSYTHNGFPVVDYSPNESHFFCDANCQEFEQSTSEGTENSKCELEESYESISGRHKFGRFRGLILRWQLIVLLQEKIFIENFEKTLDLMTLQTFRKVYPRYPTIYEVMPTLELKEYEYTIDLRPIMNPSAYTVLHTISLPRMFHLFRALGLRHLVVINDRNEVIGIVTRKDLAKHRAEVRLNSIHHSQLLISNVG